MAIAYRHSAGFGRRIEYWLISRMLREGLDVYIPLVEEPGLLKRFGEEYLTYKRNVPRWIPRLTPWESGLPDQI